MSKLKIIFTSIAFGLAWGLIGYAIIGHGAMGGLIASPLIGLIAGWIGIFDSAVWHWLGACC